MFIPGGMKLNIRQEIKTRCLLAQPKIIFVSENLQSIVISYSIWNILVTSRNYFKYKDNMNNKLFNANQICEFTKKYF